MSLFISNIFLLPLQLEDKVKYDSIFDSLNPVNGLLSGDKVKPVLLNSKLPVDILGRVRISCFLIVSSQLIPVLHSAIPVLQIEYCSNEPFILDCMECDF